MNIKLGVIVCLFACLFGCGPIESDPEPSTPGECEAEGGKWVCEPVDQPGGGVGQVCDCE